MNTRDNFPSGHQSIVSVLRPEGPGWTERPIDSKYSMGYPVRAFFHAESLLAVMSAVEVVEDGEGKGPEYHISISKQTMPPSRCDSNEAKWVLEQFKLAGAEEDNHVPHGIVRNFWRTVAEPLIGLECPCKDKEPAIKEDKGDFIWRPVSE